MQYAADSSAHSAATIARLLSDRLPIRSVLDVGCAYGTWVKAWIQAGVVDAAGMDGDYVDRARIEIANELFVSHDLNQSFDLGRRFDLVQSLEVGEHIKPSSSEDFVASIAAHASTFVLFSAAPPGQGGEFHINEQPYDYWRELFGKHGFVPVDWLRKSISSDVRISYWYRYNTVLYVRNESQGDLPAEMAACILEADVPIPDVSPLLFRLRKMIVGLLPSRLQHEVARLKSWIFPTSRF